MSERERAIARAVHLSNEIGNRHTSRRRKEELHCDLMDLVREWNLTSEEIENYIEDERQRERDMTHQRYLRWKGRHES